MSSRRRKLERRRRRRRSMSDVPICELCKSVRKIPVSRRWRGGLCLGAPRVAAPGCISISTAAGGLDQKDKYDDIYLYSD